MIVKAVLLQQSTWSTPVVNRLPISMNLSISRQRRQGYEEAIRRYNHPCHPELIIHCRNDEEENYRLIRELLLRERPDGIFASVEKLAVQVYHICRDLGRSIPGDVKVIGFSNLVTASLLSPALTTITQPAYEMEKKAAALLFRRLDKKYPITQNDHVTLPARLEVRESTAAPVRIILPSTHRNATGLPPAR